MIMKSKDITQLVVWFLVMTSFMVVLWAVFKIEMPASNRDLALILLGVLASKFGDVVGYFYNSSKGSSEKTEIISKLPPVAILILSLFLFASCSTQKTLVKEVPIQYKEKVITRLVKVKPNDDSIRMKAMFECDSLNQVVLKSVSEQKTPGVSSNANFANGLFDYKMVVIHDTVYVEAKDSIIYKEVAVKIEVPVEVNRLTKWQTFQIMFNRILFFGLVVWMVIHYLNPISTVFKKLLKLK